MKRLILNQEEQFCIEILGPIIFFAPLNKKKHMKYSSPEKYLCLIILFGTKNVSCKKHDKCCLYSDKKFKVLFNKENVSVSQSESYNFSFHFV